MIAYVEGTLLHSDAESCVLLTTGGVGYHLYLTSGGVSHLPSSGGQVRLYAYTLVREDALTLFGFATWEERQAFVTLLGAPKLGPRTALAMLGCYSPAELATCIAREDVNALTRIPGIGAKTAKRLLLDLKDKLAASGHTASLPITPVVSAMADTAAALVSLGYSRGEIDEVVRQVFENDPDLDTGAAIRQALKLFASK